MDIFKKKLTPKGGEVAKGFEEKFGETITKKISSEVFEYIKSSVKAGDMKDFISDESFEEMLPELEKAIKLAPTPPVAPLKEVVAPKIDLRHKTWADLEEEEIDINCIFNAPEEEEDLDSGRILLPSGFPEELKGLLSSACREIGYTMQESDTIAWISKGDHIFESPATLSHFLKVEKDLAKLTSVKLMIRLIRGITKIGDDSAKEADFKSTVFPLHVQLLQMATLTKNENMKSRIDHVLGKINVSRKRTVDQLTHYFESKCVESVLKSLETIMRKVMVKRSLLPGWNEASINKLKATLNALKPSKRAILQSSFKQLTKEVNVETVGRNNKKIFTKESRTFQVPPQIRSHQINLSGPEQDLINSINAAIKPEILLSLIEEEKELDIFEFSDKAREIVQSLEKFSDRTSKIYSTERDCIKLKARELQNKSEADKSKKELLPFYFSEAALKYERSTNIVIPFSEWFKKDWKELSEIPSKDVSWAKSIATKKIHKIET